MILAIDIGNTNIAVGCGDIKNIKFVEHLSTNQHATVIEYAVLLKSILDFNKTKREEIQGAVISSVVPTITETLCRAVEKITGIKPLAATAEIADIKTSLDTQIGIDLIAGALAGMEKYSLPLAVIDMGTATTITVVNREREFMGGMIMPGFKVSLDSLTKNTSQLPRISFDSVKNLIGKNTADCMKSGIIYGTASCIDGMLGRIEEELGERVTAIATGGFAEFTIPYCNHDIVIDDKLVLEGLVIIYNKNKILR